MSELEAIAKRIDGVAGDTLVRGTHLGIPVMLVLVGSDSESNQTEYTAVTAELPQRYPLELHVYAQDASREKEVERGMMVDITVGDPALDAEYIIEAAPAEVVRRLLDPETRELLRRVLVGRGCELESWGDAERRLTLRVRGALTDVAQAMAAIELVTRLAARVRDAFSEGAGSSGAPFRAETTSADDRERTATRDAEVARVRDVRERRKYRDLARWLGMLFAVVLGLVLVLQLC